MQSYTIKGLIVKEVNVGESDKLITILTKELGQISVFCKGVRNIKSRRLAATQLFVYAEFVLSVKGGKYYLTDSSVENTFFELNSSLESLSLAQYFCHVVSTVTVENEDQSDILSLTLNSLFMLCQKNADHTKIKAVFELRLAVLLGFCPDLFSCGICQRSEKEISCDQNLDVGGGMLVCSDCLFSSQNQALDVTPNSVIIPLSHSVLFAMRYIVASSPKKIFSFKLEGEDLKSLASACERYLLYHLNRGFETLEFYHSIQDL